MMQHLPTNASGTRTQILLSSLNFLLSIMGYPLAMALLSPLGTDIEFGDNAYFTYPYRAIQLSVAALAIVAVRNFRLPKISWKLGLLGVFWALYIVRAFWDLVVSPPYGSSFAWSFYPGRELYFICYVVLDFVPLLAILKGWSCIDFQRILRWMLVLGGIGLLFSLQNMHTQIDASWTGELGRVAATQMLHTQALGNFGCYLAIASLWTFFNYPKIFWKIVSLFIGILATYMMLKAGSRGPVFGFILVSCVWFSIRNKNIIIVSIAGILAIGLLILFQDSLLDFIKEISPTMEARMRATLERGDTSGRVDLWSEYWSECQRNPVMGFQLERLGYPHNMLIDGFMMFGFIGGLTIPTLILCAFKSVWDTLRYHIPNSWWVLFLLCQLTQFMTQSCFSGAAIQAPLLLLFIFEKNLKQQPQSMKQTIHPNF